jgi:predicted aspartyl protease
MRRNHLRRFKKLVVLAAIVCAVFEYQGATYATSTSDSTLAVPVRSPATAAAATAPVVPFTTVLAGQIVVPLYVDDVGPLRFLLDTGSSGSAISEALAAKLGVPLVAKTELLTVTGTSIRPVVRLTNVRLGRAQAQTLLAPTLSAEALRQVGPGVVGILGQDFLSRFTYTLDYRNSRLVWHEDGELPVDDAENPKRVRLALRPSEGRFLVDLPQGEAGSPPASFVPDSGADGLILFGRATTSRLLAETAAQHGNLIALAGDRAARQVVLKRLRIGAATLWNQPALVMIDADRLPGMPDGDGLLPLSVFATVTFNNRDGYLLVEPRD